MVSVTEISNMIFIRHKNINSGRISFFEYINLFNVYDCKRIYRCIFKDDGPHCISQSIREYFASFNIPLHGLPKHSAIIINEDVDYVKISFIQDTKDIGFLPKRDIHRMDLSNKPDCPYYDGIEEVKENIPQVYRAKRFCCLGKRSRRIVGLVKKCPIEKIDYS